MEKFFLVSDVDNKIIDNCLAPSIKEAQQIFDIRGWMIGDVLSEADYMNEHQLNQLENQSSEQ